MCVLGVGGWKVKHCACRTKFCIMLIHIYIILCANSGGTLCHQP